MSKETAFKAIDLLVDQALPNETLTIIFFGGEPLLNFEVIKQVVEYTKTKYPNKIFDFSITTNGTLIDEQFAKLVRQNNFSVLVSMDGVGSTQDKLRPFKNGNGSSSTIENNLKNVLTDYPASVRSTITQENIDLVNLYNDLSKLGFKRIYCTPVSTDDNNLQIKESEIDTLRSGLIDLANMYLECIKKEKRFAFGGFKNALSQIAQSKKSEYGCGAGKRFITVTPEGDLYPCHRFVGREAYKIGVLDDGVDKVYLDRYWKEVVGKRKDCSKCWIRNYCGGGCLWEASDEEGNISVVSDPILCEYRRLVFEVAIDLFARLERLDKKGDSNE